MFYGIVIIVAIICVACGEYAEPPPTLDPQPHTTWSQVKVGESRKADINIPFTATDGTSDFVAMLRLDLVADSGYDRGYAHGYLLANEIVEFAGPKLNQYYRDIVMDIDVSQFPEPLQKIFSVLKVMGAAAAPSVMHEALAWVWEQQEQYTPQYLIDEMNGLGVGICDGLGTTNCDSNEWADKVKAVNMLPELIRMACTAYGAWGKATPDGNLVQMRALDFGTGPFANYTVVATYRSPAATGNAFVSVSFPGFVGVITGVSQSGIGVSEKVWMTYDTPDLQPGTYQGEADVMVLRDILELSKNRVDAETYLKQAQRTWAIWIGIGDYETNVFDLVGYTMDSADVYTDETMPTMTGQPYLESVAYVDKHPQPTHDGPNGTLPTALTDFYGNITLETGKTIVQYHQTGDLHTASYDFGASQMYVSLGRINTDGKYCDEECVDSSIWKAYNRPHLKFDLQNLWQGI